MLQKSLYFIFLLRCLEHRSLLGEYDVFCELDLEGMAKFILDMHLSMYRERNECHVERGCGSLDLVGATWHWSDLTFIEPSV